MSVEISRTWTEVLDRTVDAHAGRLVAIRRHLHAHPEPSGQEFATTSFLSTELRAVGIDAVVVPTGRGLIVDGPASGHTPRVALRADIDGLLIQDAKHVDYRSQVAGVMHACGHDGHAATVFGALLALQAAAAEHALPWPVAWRGIFQPAEEVSRGAHEMITAGALDGVDMILSLHMDPSRVPGHIGLRAGVLTAACDEIDVRIEGRGGHAARPHDAIDPLAAAAELIRAVYLQVSRATDAHDPAVVTFCQISGGENSNVIPDRVPVRGTLRTLGEGVRARTKDAIARVARGVAEITGTRIQVEFLPGPPAVVNDLALNEVLRRAAVDVVGPAGIDEIARPSMGGEDFAWYLDLVPGAMFRLGCASSASSPSLHSPLFDLDERALAIGAKTLARAAVLASARGRRRAMAEGE